MPITANVLWFIPFCGEMSSIQIYVIKFVSDLQFAYDFLLVLLFPPQIMWSSLSLTCSRSVVFSWYSYFLHKLCDQVCQWFSPVTLFSSTNKADHHYIIEILLKVVLSTRSFSKWKFNTFRILSMHYYSYIYVHVWK